MKIVVLSVMHNEAEILPFFLRHYMSIADKLIVYSDNSTDGTDAILDAYPKVERRAWPFITGLDDIANLDLAVRVNEELESTDFDWIIWVDADEFVIGNFISLASISANIVRCEGYNMIFDGLPNDDGRSQIWELCQTGVESPTHSKPIIYRNGVRPSWFYGKHCLNASPRHNLDTSGMFALLHYRFLGKDYTAKRNARNWNRVLRREYAWSCDPEYTGTHSATWAESIHQAENVALKWVQQFTKSVA